MIVVCIVIAVSIIVFLIGGTLVISDGNRYQPVKYGVEDRSILLVDIYQIKYRLAFVFVSKQCRHFIQKACFSGTRRATDGNLWVALVVWVISLGPEDHTLVRTLHERLPFSLPNVRQTPYFPPMGLPTEVRIIA